jgi:MFS family permease
VGSAFTIAYGISQLPAGWLADRVGARYLLLASITGVAIIGAVVGLSPGFGALLAALLIMGILGGGYHPSSASVIARAVPEQRRGRAMGIHIVGGSSSYFVAPLIAAGLVSVAGWRGTFLTLSVPVAVLGVGLFWMMRRTFGAHDRNLHVGTPPAAGGARSEAHTHGARPADAPSGSRTNSKRVRTQLIFFMIVVGLHGATIGSLIPFIPLYLADIRGVDERLAAGFISIIFATGFFAAPLGGWLSDTFGRVRVMIGVVLLSGPAIVLATVAPFPVGIGLVLALLGTLMFTKMPTAEAHIASAVVPRHRTTVLGIYYFSGAEVGAILTPILGASIDARGFDASFTAAGIIYAAVAVVCSVGMIATRAPECATSGEVA